MLYNYSTHKTTLAQSVQQLTEISHQADTTAKCNGPVNPSLPGRGAASPTRQNRRATDRGRIDARARNCIARGNQTIDTRCVVNHLVKICVSHKQPSVVHQFARVDRKRASLLCPPLSSPLEPRAPRLWNAPVPEACQHQGTLTPHPLQFTCPSAERTCLSSHPTQILAQPTTLYVRSTLPALKHNGKL